MSLAADEATDTSLSSADSKAEEKVPLQPLPEIRLLIGREEARGSSRYRDRAPSPILRGNEFPCLSIETHRESREDEEAEAANGLDRPLERTRARDPCLQLQPMPTVYRIHEPKIKSVSSRYLL